MRICVECRQAKPLDAFYRRRTSPDGRAAKCLDCGAAKAQKDNSRRAERLASDPAYLQRVRGYSREYRRRVKAEVYNTDVVALMEWQDGRCAICRRTAEEVDLRGRSGEVLHVDHDHACCPLGGSCGECVRGLLCRKCNSALALFDDDPERLMAAAQYIRDSLRAGVK